MKVYYYFLALIAFVYILRPREDELSQKNANIRTALVVFVGITCLLGLKSLYVGIDTQRYYYKYLSCEIMMRNLKDIPEFGFVLLMNFFKKLGFSWQMYLFTVSAFMSGTLTLFIYKYSKNVALSSILFVTIGLFGMYMSGLRQSIAISICLAAYMILMSQLKPILRYAAFCSLVYVAYTIHNSALVFYVMIILCNLRLTKFQVFVMLGVVLLSFIYRDAMLRFLTAYLPQRYEDRDMFAEEHGLNMLYVIIYLLIPLVCNIFNMDYDEKGKYSKELSVAFSMSAMALLFYILGQKTNIISRNAYYFENANLLLVPNTLRCFKRGSERTMLTYFLIIICIIYFVMGTVDGTLRNDHYTFFWQWLY